MGSGLVNLPNLEIATTSENAPGDAGELIGEGNCQHVAVQSLPGGLDPGFEPVAFPCLGLDQHNPCRLNEQDAQVAIAALGYLAEDASIIGSRECICRK